MTTVTSAQDAFVRTRLVWILIWLTEIEPAETDKSGQRYRLLSLRRIYQELREIVFKAEGAAPQTNPDGSPNPDSVWNDPKHWLNRFFSVRRISAMLRQEMSFVVKRNTADEYKGYAVELTAEALRPGRKLDKLRKQYLPATHSDWLQDMLNTSFAEKDAPAAEGQGA